MVRPLEVGNYDILEGKFFPARGSTANWNEISKDEDPKALIVIGDSKQVFVGASKNAPAKTGYSSNYGGNNNRDRDIKRGMCFNNATTIIRIRPRLSRIIARRFGRSHHGLDRCSLCRIHEAIR